MVTKVHDIRIAEDIKDKAATLYASLGLDLSGAINVFLRVSLNEKGFPFPVKLPLTESIEEKRTQTFKDFLIFAGENPVFEKGYTFDRDACHERKVLR